MVRTWYEIKSRLAMALDFDILIKNEKALALAISILFCSRAVACETSNIEELRKFWNEFVISSLRDTPSEITNFYLFPLKIRGHYQDDRPIIVTRKIFLAQYDAIFRKNVVDGEKGGMLGSFDKIANPPQIANLPQTFNPDGCLNKPFEARIGEYQLKWRAGKGWAVYGVFYAEDFDPLVQYFKSIK